MQNGKAYKAKELEMIMNCGKMVRPVFAVPYHVCPKLKKSLSLVWQFTILAGFCSENASLGSEGMNKKKIWHADRGSEEQSGTSLNAPETVGHLSSVKDEQNADNQTCD